MKFSKYLLTPAIVAVLGSTTVLAADGSITFKGKVTAAACSTEIVVKGSGNTTGSTATLELPSVTAATLNAGINTYVGQTPFSIQLTGCQATTGLDNVRVLFTSANPPSGDAHVMANTATDNAANNVAVAIMQPNGTTQIDLNGGTAVDDGQLLPTAAPGPITLNYLAAYKSLSTEVTPGNVTGVADFVISYF